MSNYTYITSNTRTLDDSDYYLENLDCAYCANYRNHGGHGCGRSKCEYEDIRLERIEHGRIKRRKELDKCREE